MKGSIKIVFVTGVLLALVVSASGCTVNPGTPTPTPTAATTAPKTTESVPGSIDSYFESLGYTVTRAFSYSSVDTYGYPVYNGTLREGGYFYAVDVTVCPNSSAAASDLALGVRAAGDLGYSGSYVSDTHWSGVSSDGYYHLDLWTTSDNWSISSTGAAI
jgi:hypothetical protein